MGAFLVGFIVGVAVGVFKDKLLGMLPQNMKDKLGIK